MRPRSQGGRRWPPGSLATARVLGVAAASAAWLLLFYRFSHPNADTCRDLLYARDLAEGRLLHLAGVHASLGNLWQGALFPALMGLGLALHAPIVGVRAAMLALFVASAVALFAGARWRLGPRAAWVATVLWAGLGPRAVSLQALDNPNLLALPLVAFTLALLDLADDWGLLAAAAAGAALGLAVLAHVDAALLGPALVLALLWGRRPAWGLGVGLAALAATVAALSPETAVVDLRGLVTRWPVLTAGGVALWIAVALGTRRRARRLDPRNRGLVLLAVASALGASALAVLAGLGAPAWTWRYLAPAFPAACLLAGAGVARVGRRAAIAGAVVLGIALAGVATRGTLAAQVPMESVPTVLADLADLGYGPEALRLRLRGPLRGPLLACATALVPRRPGPPPVDDLVLLDDWTSTDYALFSRARPLGHTQARVYRYRPWVDQVHPRICVTGPAGEQCQRTAWSGEPPRAPGAPLFDGAYPELPGVRALFREVGAPATKATVTFPLKVTGPGGARSLTLLPGRDPGSCQFRIRRVTGVRTRSPLPATRVAILGRPGEAGEVTLEVTFDSERCAPDAGRVAAPPSIVEVGEAQPGAPWRLPSRLLGSW